MTSLLKLPEEVICMIAELLDMTDLASYFGTCRRIRDLPSKWVDWVCKKVFEKHAFYSPKAYWARSDEAAERTPIDLDEPLRVGQRTTQKYLYARAFRIYTKRRHAVESNSPFQRVWLPGIESSAPFIFEQGKLCYLRADSYGQLRILDVTGSTVDRELVIDFPVLIDHMKGLPSQDRQQLRPEPLHCSHDILTLSCYPTQNDEPLIIAIDLAKKDVVFWQQIQLFEEESQLVVRNNRRFLAVGDCLEDNVDFWIYDMSRPQDPPKVFAWGYQEPESGETAWFEMVGQNIWGAVRHTQERASLRGACQYGLMKVPIPDDLMGNPAPEILNPYDRPRRKDESTTRRCPENPGMLHFQVDEQSGTLMLSDQILISGSDEETKSVHFDLGDLGEPWEKKIDDMFCPILSSIPFHSEREEGLISYYTTVSLDYDKMRREEACVSLLSYDPSINFRGLRHEGAARSPGQIPLHHQPWIWEEDALWRESCMGDDLFWKAS